MSDNRVLQIQEKISDATTGDIALSRTGGGVAFEKVKDLMEISRLMAVSDKAVPSYLRGNVGGCFAIAMQALEWGGFSPFAVARMSYVVNDQVAYMAGMLHALIERNAPLKQRLRFDFEGEGPSRVCVVTGHFKGEVDPLVYRSPQIGSIKPKNSPLWVNDPDQQLSYFSARAWARRYAPDVLLGVYAKDELEDNPHIGAERAKDVSPPQNDDLHHRLSAKAVGGAGFDAAHIEKTLGADDKKARAPADARTREETDKQKSEPEAKASPEASGEASSGKVEAAHPDIGEAVVADSAASTAAEGQGSPQTTLKDSAAAPTEPARPQDWWLAQGDEAATRGTAVLDVFLASAKPEKAFRSTTLDRWKREALVVDHKAAEARAT